MILSPMFPSASSSLEHSQLTKIKMLSYKTGKLIIILSFKTEKLIIIESYKRGKLFRQVTWSWRRRAECFRGRSKLRRILRRVRRPVWERISSDLLRGTNPWETPSRRTGSPGCCPASWWSRSHLRETNYSGLKNEISVELRE